VHVVDVAGGEAIPVALVLFPQQCELLLPNGARSDDVWQLPRIYACRVPDSVRLLWVAAVHRVPPFSTQSRREQSTTRRVKVRPPVPQIRWESVHRNSYR
jgi:hypothetical protein